MALSLPVHIGSDKSISLSFPEHFGSEKSMTEPFQQRPPPDDTGARPGAEPRPSGPGGCERGHGHRGAARRPRGRCRPQRRNVGYLSSVVLDKRVIQYNDIVMYCTNTGLNLSNAAVQVQDTQSGHGVLFPRQLRWACFRSQEFTVTI